MITCNYDDDDDTVDDNNDDDDDDVDDEHNNTGTHDDANADGDSNNTLILRRNQDGVKITNNTCHQRKRFEQKNKEMLCLQ